MRYFFRTEGGIPMEDDEGIPLVNDEAARTEALHLFRTIIVHEPRETQTRFRLFVVDEEGKEVAKVGLGQVSRAGLSKHAG